MNINEVLEMFEYRIKGGSEYLWHCWPDARYIDMQSDNASCSVVHSTVDQTVYEVTVCSSHSDIAYRWINPEWREAHLEEARNRGIDVSVAWDLVKWIDIEVESDLLSKGSALCRGEIPDSRVEVPVDISDEDFMAIARLAHKYDITINQMVEQILREEIARSEAKNV